MLATQPSEHEEEEDDIVGPAGPAPPTIDDLGAMDLVKRLMRGPKNRNMLGAAARHCIRLWRKQFAIAGKTITRDTLRSVLAEFVSFDDFDSHMPYSSFVCACVNLFCRVH